MRPIIDKASIPQAHPPKDLPDFDLVQRLSSILAAEIAAEIPKQRDIPAMDKGTGILQAIDNLREQMDRGFDQLSQRVDKLDQRFKDDLDDILEALGARTDGNDDTKCRRLRVLIGLEAGPE
ncbi:hypothetical protein B7463_g10000, partial [Scytalidium lignicola]